MHNYALYMCMVEQIVHIAATVSVTMWPIPILLFWLMFLFLLEKEIFMKLKVLLHNGFDPTNTIGYRNL